MMAFLGIVALAFLVNLVELICSGEFPWSIPNILTMSGVPTWQYYGYMLLYVLVFMADELVRLLHGHDHIARRRSDDPVLAVLAFARRTRAGDDRRIGLLRPEWLMYG